MSSSSPRIAWLAGIAVALALVSTMVYQRSYAAFTADTDTDNSWTVGSVSLTDDDAGNALLSVTGLLPGLVGQTRCITVTYTGTVQPSAVKLYTTVTDTDGGLGSVDLSDNLDFKLEHDASSGITADCTGFSPDGVLFDGKLAGLETYADYASGLDLDGTIASPPLTAWQPAQNEVRTFRVTYGLPLAVSSLLQGDSVTANLVWEAQS